ncbi:MAG: efflux RND transporter periplasmic adaptor subunit [Alphaproteobacteria bacterium]|nr:efflux RND transporter periplasmic adaptor subunit [Alphaproteobacteria bacterium]
MKKNNNIHRTYILILFAMCLFSFGLGFYMFNKLNIKDIRHIPVNEGIALNVVPLNATDIEIKNSYIGHTLAINQVDIVPFINGYLDKIFIDKGSFVKKGDLLLSIYPKEYKAKLLASEAMVLQALSDFEYYKDYYERVKKSDKNSFSATQIEEAKNNFLQADATLKKAIAEKELAKVNLDYTLIKSPIDGRVGNFDLTVGDYVSPQEAGLINIVQTNPIRVEFFLTDVEYFKFFNNNSKPFENSVIKIKTPDNLYFESIGEFKYTDNKIDKKTNSIAVYADFENTDNLILPNVFVKVDIYNKIENAITIDKNLVKILNNGYFINIARNGKIETMPVNIISETNDKYIVENTFKNGDLLILDDISNIKNETNIKFKIIK